MLGGVYIWFKGGDIEIYVLGKIDIKGVQYVFSGFVWMDVIYFVFKDLLMCWLMLNIMVLLFVICVVLVGMLYKFYVDGVLVK